MSDTNSTHIDIIIISQEPSISRQFFDKFSTLETIFKERNEGVLKFLKTKGALHQLNLNYSFKTENSNKSEVTQDFQKHFDEYLEKIFDETVENDFKKDFEEARKRIYDAILNHVHMHLPSWPNDVEQKTKHELLSCGRVDKDSYTLFWSCVGWVKVKDSCIKNSSREISQVFPSSFKNEFIREITGKPDFKFIIFDNEKLRELEKVVVQDYNKALEYLGNDDVLTWEYLK
ncbi:22230_t:CDS:1 [Cetraspora pellucida]|uniref:22230_t:CDS:1 n=1 Tax=Cetraspora pellucida TaxID=1433469 RepID=A0A9N9CB47_9GLOM|nr:22230_t:CDS:1 [Cetraspora pellucida]